MLPDTHPILVTFVEFLKNQNIPSAFFDYYKKWLRYFLDFCAKHPQIEDQAEQIKQYLEKLHSKQQSPQYCRQAAHAVSLYFEMCKKDDHSNVLPMNHENIPTDSVTEMPRFASGTRPRQFSATPSPPISSRPATISA